MAHFLTLSLVLPGNHECGFDMNLHAKFFIALASI
jgi:hypothetical protein